jgi:predicted HTH transcriptional regulator
LEYAAEGLQVTLEKVWTRVQRFMAESGSKKIVLRPRQEKLLNMLRDQTNLTPRQIWEGLGVSRQGAMDLLRPLIKAGLIRRVGTKKSGRYILA